MIELPAQVERFVPRFARPMIAKLWAILQLRPVQFVLALFTGFMLTAVAIPQAHFLLDAYKHAGF